MLDELLLSGENVEGTFKKRFILSLFMCTCVHTCMWRCPQKPEEHARSLRTGVTGDCEPLDAGYGNSAVIL